MNTLIYLDNNATTAVAPEVLAAMQPFWSERYGNPSSIYHFGGDVQNEIEQARFQVAAMLGSQPEEVIFTGSGTEGDNTAIFGALDVIDPDRRHIITSQVEHPAVQTVCRYLTTKGYRLTELRVDAQGSLDLSQLQDAITPDTALVSIMWANNETGVIFPMAEIAAIVKAQGVLLHTDAVQASGKIPIDVSQVPVDLLTISGHKFHAPKGVGALYIRKGTRIRPYIKGGHQEGGKRAGTENVAGIVGLGRASELAIAHLAEENDRVRKLRDKLEQGILSSCKDAIVNGSADRTPNTVNISFKYIEGEAILLMLDDHGICASSGSACTSGSLEPSHVMRAMGVPFTAAHGSIRFSLSVYNTSADIDRVLEVLPPIVDRLREISPFVED
ncbi:cysteine desulfurase NifS [bacterium]|nr:cysteine desulfurase NifS [bacterium]